MAGFWHSLLEGPGERTVGVVTHGGTLQSLYRLALGLPVDSTRLFDCGDTSLHEWEVRPGGTVIIRRANCTRHLES